MERTTRLVKDQTCPKCGWFETVLVCGAKTMKPLRFECLHPLCNWTGKITSRKE